MRPKGIFVTGTDTGVGKTVVAAALARLLAKRGILVGVMKPVTSGCLDDAGRLVSADAELLCYAAGIQNTDDVATYRFREPVSPADAASIDGDRVYFPVIKDAFDRLGSKYDFMIVEGAGGLMVPLSGGLLVADLARELGLSLLVVARPALGTINHTVLTCFSAHQMGLEVAGIIISGMPERPGLAERLAPHQIGSLAGAPVLGIWPSLHFENQTDLVDELAEWLDSQAETEILLREIGLGTDFTCNSDPE